MNPSQEEMIARAKQKQMTKSIPQKRFKQLAI
jgi:hypothetical protein